MPDNTPRSTQKPAQDRDREPIRMEDKDVRVRDERLLVRGPARRPWSSRDKTERGW